MPDRASDPMGPESEAARISRVYEGYKQADRARLYDRSNRGNQAIFRERERATRRALARVGFADLSGRLVLDVGCGVGDQLARMRKLGAAAVDLVGIDLLPDRIAEARRRHPDIQFRVANAVDLEFPDASFDLLLSSAVFSSILDGDTARMVAAEMVRVLRPGGVVLWYDLRVGNPRNPNVRGITEKEVRALFPKLSMQLRSITLMPPLARRLGPFTWAGYPLLTSLPFLRTHLFGLLAKPATKGPPPDL